MRRTARVAADPQVSVQGLLPLPASSMPGGTCDGMVGESSTVLHKRLGSNWYIARPDSHAAEYVLRP